MMLVSFAAMEAVHQEAYSLLLETLGKSDDEYQKFAEIQAMSDNINILQILIRKIKQEWQKQWPSKRDLKEEGNYLGGLLYF